MTASGGVGLEPGAQAVERFMLELLAEIAEDLDLPELTHSTPLGSLGLESINLVYLIAELQGEFGLGDALIARLRADQIDIREFEVREMAALVDGLRPPARNGGAA
jgi:hypothetical protein